MRIITISDDKAVLKEIEELKQNTLFQFEHYAGSKNNLEVFSFLCSKPNRLIEAFE